LLRHTPCTLPYLYNFEAGWGDGKALAERTSAWSAQSASFLKDELAFEATGWFHDEVLPPGRSCNVLEMIQSLSFLDMKDF